LHLVGILFPHINDDARPKSLQTYFEVNLADVEYSYVCLFPEPLGNDIRSLYHYKKQPKDQTSKNTETSIQETVLHTHPHPSPLQWTLNICLVAQHKFILFSFVACQLRGNSLIDNIVFFTRRVLCAGKLVFYGQSMIPFK